ncbi:hypothetical protein GQF61_04825 [Sphingobacterium sp. DK4209]|uniref:Uncharacterized protein n=1 Tax=Sphingobacterium zhuxiongii TaxID=2662364 RepID=A0A5Q0Q9A2_9SPHI|nr:MULTISPECIES: hypothetical protein [unclassified Sphingobacterium]MVZ65166.1 hypothetical protein [Sphingobacterium sp. DK4209]QGA26113.1 hypothetical protein GFH32_07155 [Sphingobacterium sp. dk4302]
MESKKNRDIIDHIVRSLRDKEELPYREGAWENFQSSQFGPKRSKSAVYYWAASAAAALLFGFFAVNRWVESPISENTLSTVNSGPSQEAIIAPETQDSNSTLLDYVQADNLQAGNSISSGANSSVSNWMSFQNTNPDYVSETSRTEFTIGDMQAASVDFVNKLANIPMLQPAGVVVEHSVNFANAKPRSDGPMNQVMAYQGDQFAVQSTGSAPKLSQKKFSFAEKFDLGLFVSPSSTDEQMNFGGGMLLGYNITKNLSVRTGLAYNQYQVGLMKDPVGNPETQVLASSDVLEQDAKYSMITMQASRTMILPNVNAVSGNVQAFEIPLEVKFKANSGIYASSGMTYAVVLNQNRFTHFIENANADLFDKGLPSSSKEMNDAVQPVTRKVKTDEQNVNTNNFGGFINLSIGKEMKVNKRLNLSVEPYVKLPVGSFKQADMNYTNGGIRIITNF